MPEAKSSVPILQLKGGHSQVKQDSVYRAEAVSGTDSLQVLEVIIDQEDRIAI